jgi:uncharacterized protein (DUF2267 family)
MSTTGIRNLDRAIHKSNEWINELDEEFGWNDKQRTYQSLRAVLHALRDRLRAEESVQLAAQLPMTIKGMYFDGWKPSKTPTKIRNQEEFLQRIVDEYGGPDASAPDQMARAVFRHLDRHVSKGEIDDVKASLPEQLRQLWPESEHEETRSRPSGDTGHRPSP